MLASLGPTPMSNITEATPQLNVRRGPLANNPGTNTIGNNRNESSLANYYKGTLDTHVPESSSSIVSNPNDTYETPITPIPPPKNLFHLDGFVASKFDAKTFAEGAKELEAAKTDDTFLDDATELSSGFTHTTFKKTIEGKDYVIKPYTPNKPDTFSTDSLGVQVHMYASKKGIAPPSLAPIKCKGNILMISEFLPIRIKSKIVDDADDHESYTKLLALHEKINESGLDFEQDSFSTFSDSFVIQNDDNVLCNAEACYVSDVDKATVGILSQTEAFKNAFVTALDAGIQMNGNIAQLEGFEINLNPGMTEKEKITRIASVIVNEKMKESKQPLSKEQYDAMLSRYTELVIKHFFPNTQGH